ncbi:MAG: LytTR family transcriptional regulator DNA-binding domain-containing protein [Thermodesulfobacteriota bacterium]|nr:LytTR family transcriptional regulator DNA-binding domain-containing protein [Thermodesulfobacteriota bacterium]
MGQDNKKEIRGKGKELLFSLGIGVVVIDLENQITFMNPFAEKMLARIRNHVIGLNVQECHLPEHREGVNKLIKQTLESGDQSLPMVKIIDGPTTLLSVRLSPLLDSRDQRIGVVLVINDLTSETVVAEKETSPAHLMKLPIFEKGKILLLDVDRIVFMKSVRNYTSVHTYDKEFLSNLPLGELEKRFEKKLFFRVHRSFMVNLSKIEELSSIRSGRYHIRVDNKEKTVIPVSRKGVDKLRKILRF